MAPLQGRARLDLGGSNPLRFLALCARPQMDDDLRRRLAAEAANVDSWDLIAVAAEYHEIVGLLHTHLKTAEIRLPEEARRTLEGFVARARHATLTRLRVLAEVLQILEARGIETLVLKGGALAFTLYDEPAHRPLADLDLWVKRERVGEARASLLREGFTDHSAHGLPEHRHLAPASRELDGVRVLIELHHTLGIDQGADPDAVLKGSSRFQVNGQLARTLGPADMLAQLHHHLVYHLVFHRCMRLKWIADLVGVAERYADTIDWAGLRSVYPAMPGALAMVHLLSPLSRKTRDLCDIAIPYSEPPGIDEELSVLPKPQQEVTGESVSDIQDRPDWLSADAERSLADTLWPAEWRLRLFWGLDQPRALIVYRWRYLQRVIAFGTEIWKSHGGSLATLSRRPWIRSRLQPLPHRDIRG